MERLDAPVHHLGKTGVIGHVAHGETGLLQVPPRAAGAKDFHARSGERTSKISKPRLIAHANERALNWRRSLHGLNQESGVRSQESGVRSSNKVGGKWLTPDSSRRPRT